MGYLRATKTLAAWLLTAALIACDGGPLPRPTAPPVPVPIPGPATALPPATEVPGPPATEPPATATLVAAGALPPTLAVLLLPTFTPLPAPPLILPTSAPAAMPPTRALPATEPTVVPPSRTARPVATPAPVRGYRRAATPLVVLDPGHGGSEIGAVSAGGLTEKGVNLAIALAAEADLRAQGIAVLLTRRNDTQVNAAGGDVNGDGTRDADDDLQARVDLANGAGAWALVSIHNNAQPGDLATRGTTTYYCSDGLNPAASRALADTLHRRLLAAMGGAGYAGADRGVRDDYELRKPEGHLYLLGPHNKRITRPSLMPGALGETLFLSNAADAAQLARPEMIAALGAGYAAGISAYLATVAP